MIQRPNVNFKETFYPDFTTRSGKIASGIGYFLIGVGTVWVTADAALHLTHAEQTRCESGQSGDSCRNDFDIHLSYLLVGGIGLIGLGATSKFLVAPIIERERLDAFTAKPEPTDIALLRDDNAFTLDLTRMLQEMKDNPGKPPKGVPRELPGDDRI